MNDRPEHLERASNAPALVEVAQLDLRYEGCRLKSPGAEARLLSAIAAGGIGTILELTKQLDVRGEINRAVPILKLHLPYDEADHVLNIALNLLAGGTCLDHLEDRRCDEAYLNALGAERIPDPTTAGTFFGGCRTSTFCN